jgi:hypothetical protein
MRFLTLEGDGYGHLDEDGFNTSLPRDGQEPTKSYAQIQAETATATAKASLRLLDLTGDLDVRVVVVAGSRRWTDRAPIENALIDLRVRSVARGYPMTVRHGAARGADSAADFVARFVLGGVTNDPMPAEWYDANGHYNQAAGRERNVRILDKVPRPDLWLVFKDDGEWQGLAPNARGGTEHGCRIAIAAGVLTLRWSHEHGWERLGPAPNTDTDGTTMGETP